MAGKVTLFCTREKAERLRMVIEDCGMEACVSPQEDLPSYMEGFFIFEARDFTDLSSLSEAEIAGPFLIYADFPLPSALAATLKERGLAGVLTAETSGEDVSFMINSALFRNRTSRRNLRAPVNIPVEIRSSSRAISTSASLLSRDGMFVQTLKPLSPDALCEISFTLPGTEREIRTKARVLYTLSINNRLNIISGPEDPFKRVVSHPGMAVYFIDLPDGEREAIDSYVKSL